MPIYIVSQRNSTNPTDVAASEEGGKIKTLFCLMDGRGTGKSVTIAVVCKRWVDSARDERSSGPRCACVTTAGTDLQHDASTIHLRLELEGRLAAANFCRHDNEANEKPLVIVQTICRMPCNNIDGCEEELVRTEGLAEAATTDKLGEACKVRLAYLLLRLVDTREGGAARLH